MTPEQISFLAGATAMGFATSALFFARFWHRTHDLLFGLFCFAFGLLAVEQVTLVLIGADSEKAAYVYILRLSAFVVIAVGIVLKNVSKSAPPR